MLGGESAIKDIIRSTEKTDIGMVNENAVSMQTHTHTYMSTYKEIKEGAHGASKGGLL